MAVQEKMQQLRETTTTGLNDAIPLWRENILSMPIFNSGQKITNVTRLEDSNTQLLQMIEDIVALEVEGEKIILKIKAFKGYSDSL